MLGRYWMKRGRALREMPAPVRQGVRQDTRKHTRHPLRPDPADVRAALAGDLDWGDFADRYRHHVRQRRAENPALLDDLAQLARERDVFLGCSCPTKTQPDVRRCHTWLALELMAELYPDLDVRFPEPR